ncbi:hypothetical protein CLOM621_06456 [Clostridium sp. M62/1]|nr:hypothetical protein CLOM621_06456 [Clostridium sp. M62/1]
MAGGQRKPGNRSPAKGRFFAGERRVRNTFPAFAEGHSFLRREVPSEPKLIYGQKASVQ